MPSLAVASFHPIVDGPVGLLDVRLEPLDGTRPCTGRIRLTLLAWMGTSDQAPDRARELVGELRSLPLGA